MARSLMDEEAGGCGASPARREKEPEAADPVLYGYSPAVAVVA